jgi:hypothetical protein
MKAQEVTRKEFFQGILRNGIFTGITGMAALLLWKSAGKPTCLDHGICQSCPVSGACTLPEKKEVK